MALITMIKDDKEILCNSSDESIKQLVKFGWRLKPAKKKRKKRTSISAEKKLSDE